MHKTLKTIIIGTFICVWSCTVYGEEVSREQIKGLDEQVQEIKSDVLSIATQLHHLEEKLLYPSHTQVAMFMDLNEGERFRLDTVEIRLDGEPVAHHIYTFKELEALRMGGVQRIYTGNIKTGEHTVLVSFSGKSKTGSPVEQSELFTVQKNVGPSIVQITLANQGITLKER